MIGRAKVVTNAGQLNTGPIVGKLLHLTWRVSSSELYDRLGLDYPSCFPFYYRRPMPEDRQIEWAHPVRNDWAITNFILRIFRILQQLVHEYSAHSAPAVVRNSKLWYHTDLWSKLSS